MSVTRQGHIIANFKSACTHVVCIHNVDQLIHNVMLEWSISEPSASATLAEVILNT